MNAPVPATLLLRGVDTPVNVLHFGTAAGCVMHVGGQLRVRLPYRARQEPETALPLIVAWLREEARHDVVARVAVRAPQLGVSPGPVRIGDQRTRWASCSGTGTLSFSWRLVLAPPPVLDYVVVHELAHLLHPHHQTAFWACVCRFCPDYYQHKRWLRENHRRLVPEVSRP